MNTTAVDKKTRDAKQIMDDAEWLLQNHPDSQNGAVAFRHGRMFVKRNYFWEYQPVAADEEE